MYGVDYFFNKAVKFDRDDTYRNMQDTDHVYTDLHQLDRVVRDIPEWPLSGALGGSTGRTRRGFT